jgi:hypothetical protein
VCALSVLFSLDSFSFWLVVPLYKALACKKTSEYWWCFCLSCVVFCFQWPSPNIEIIAQQSSLYSLFIRYSNDVSLVIPFIVLSIPCQKHPTEYFLYLLLDRFKLITDIQY